MIVVDLILEIYLFIITENILLEIPSFYVECFSDELCDNYLVDVQIKTRVPKLLFAIIGQHFNKRHCEVD